MWSEYDYLDTRTDLAIEAQELFVKEEGPPEIPGVEVYKEEGKTATVTRIFIKSKVGAQMMNKLPGNYTTIEAQGLRQRDVETREEVSQLLAKELTRYTKDLDTSAVVLVIGLGNWNATPDALGPKVVNKIMVTRHLYQLVPAEGRGGLRPVAALAPGVLGLTGIETGEIILGVTQRIKPGLVICIDALASRSSKRLCSTVQISDTGINPGAGVGNRRLAITPEVLGVPVVSIGVPTVIHATTIINDGLRILEEGPEAFEQDEDVPRATSLHVDPRMITHPERTASKEGGSNQRKQVIQQLLTPYMGSMIVTPKEIDVLIDDVADVLAGGLNACLHEQVDLNEVLKYIQ
ncbi:MAG: GPR endopeptidase [Limnochordia bacterium]|jgi:spore protease|nr:GPR endopeptidase [Limnochordia bacterium]MDD2628562.1 GPR endopeptidase [Limnochordia bacterium]MDD4517445.1 GPR endopeptidase [Limnochordia bacterium]